MPLTQGSDTTYSGPGESLGSLLYNYNDEDEVINQIVNQVVNDLDVEGLGRTLVSQLMKTNLKKVLAGREGMLNRYYNIKLQKLLPEIYLNFDLEPEELEIDTNHQDSTKLYSIFKALKKRYDISEPKRTGTPKSFGKKNPIGENTMESGPSSY
jgi:hypothetical protein